MRQSQRLSSDEPATAIVLAGGRSTRMGVDKSLLPLRGKPLIQHVCDQIRPIFDELLIAGDDPGRFGFLGADVVPDEVAGQGPLRAIASALAVSRHDLNFVAACDTPFINKVLLDTLLLKAEECDCVVPVTSAGHYEPLFAVYRKSVLPAMRRALEEGERRVVAVLGCFKTETVRIAPSDEIKNINTMEDYRKLLLASRQDRRPTEGARSQYRTLPDPVP